jgi:voltage-gated potassium channel
MRLHHKVIEMLPVWENSLEKNDLLLFVGDANAQDHLKYVANNFYEFHCVYYGREKSFFNKSYAKKLI